MNNKVRVKVYDTGGIGCLSKSCPFKSECANHTTAGDFRFEDGFTPQLYAKDNEFFCDTKMQETDENIHSFTVPVNKSSLGHGALVMKNSKIQLADSIFPD